MTRRSPPNPESPNKRFQAFEFGADDEHVEKHSAKMMAKFRSLAKRRSVKKAKSNDVDSPIIKYKFLQLFTKNPDKESSNQPVDVDGGEAETTKTPQEKVRALLLDDDASDVSHGPGSSVPLRVGTLSEDGAARDMAGVDVYDLSSCLNQKNKQVCSVSDDDDENLEPSTLVFRASKTGAPLQEQSSELGVGGCERESVEEAITNLHLESKKYGGAGDANNTSGIEIYPHCSKGRDAIESLDFSFDEEVIYPKGDPNAVSISKKDFELLQPETFINDTIVDFYIQYLKRKIHPEEERRFHFFNSFFFRKLTDIEKDQSSCEAKAAFQRVHKWTRKVSIFEKDYIFIPVNKSLHWSLIVICHPGEGANVEDDEVKSLLKVPCILHMDSIKGSHRGLKNLIQRYLCEEWKERHGETAADVSLKFLNLRFFDLQLPQQGNSFDCGLFLLHYVERFLEEAPVNFSLSNIRNSSKFLKKNWFPPADASVKRSQIKKLLCTILKDHSGEALVADSLDKDLYSNNKDKQQTGIHFPEKISSSTERFCSNSSSFNASGTGISLLGASPPIQLPTRSLSLMPPLEEVEDSEDQVSDSQVDVEDCQKGTGLGSDLLRKSYCWQESSWKHGFPEHIVENVDETWTSSSGSENLSALRIDQDHSLMVSFNNRRKTDASESSSSEEIAHLVVLDSEEENDAGMQNDTEVKYFLSSLEEETDSTENINPKEINMPWSNGDPVLNQQAPKRPRLTLLAPRRRLRQSLISTLHL